VETWAGLHYIFGTSDVRTTSKSFWGMSFWGRAIYFREDEMITMTTYLENPYCEKVVFAVY